MELIKEQGQFDLNVYLKESDKYVAIIYGGNGDLYWLIHSKEENANYQFMEITKENYGIYNLFNKLFYDVENINIFDEEFLPFYIEYEEDKQEYKRKHLKEIEEKKENYRLNNIAHYNELYNSKEQIITWYSDETAREVGNFLTIKKEDNLFRIEFHTQPYIKGFDKDFGSLKYIPVRFRNSGSIYHPFNSLFMKMYNEMKCLDDIKDIGHQMHIEEYLYDKSQTRTREKNN